MENSESDNVKKEEEEEKEKVGVSEEIESLKKELEETKKLKDNYYDRLLRLQAEFENYKKRSAKEHREFMEYANENLVINLLDVVDSFESALKSNNEVLEKDGVERIYRQFYNILEKEGLSYIDAIGKEFNHYEHEAVSIVETNEHPEHTIIEELQKGYKFKSKVIRPSMVKVAKREKK
ncbi:MAG: nucleotide exchange factor GrpE [Methanosarcinales archaeon]